MRISVVLLVATLAMTILSACVERHKTPSCTEAVERGWSRYWDGPWPEHVQPYVDEEIALCLELQAEAEMAGCLAEHADWRECLYRQEFGSYSSECPWWVDRLEACVEGADFEEDCDDAQDNPDLQYSCTTAVDGAVPGIRIFNVVSAFNEQEDLAAWAYSSICSADYTPILAGIGYKIKGLLDFQCLPSPLRGCSDVGAEFGIPRAAQTCSVNERCLPDCSVGETRYRGTADEYEVWLPPCLEVCAEGYCEGNTDRSLAYGSGHPSDRDPDLPVEACWHISYQENCPASNYAELLVARQTDPPPRTFLGAACVQISRDEQLCNDGQDNDEDCLVDTDDPCCQNSANCVQ